MAERKKYEITFLGTGHGVPSVDRFCSSTIVECGGQYYLIDVGAPVAQLLIRYNIPYDALRAVFITHRHDDHTFGLPHLLSLCSWYYRNSHFTTYLSEEKILDIIRDYLLTGENSFAENRLPLKVTKPGTFYQDENITVQAIPTDHMCGQHPSYAFLIEGDGKRVLFTGDLHATDPVDFPEVAYEKPTDAIVCELVHFPPEAIEPKLEKCQTKLVLFNHYHDHWAIPAIEKMDFPFPAKAAHDGDVYILQRGT